MMVREPDDLPILTGQHRVQRLNFAREHQNWQLRHVTGGQYSSHMRAGSLCQLMTDVLWRGDVSENITQTVTLSKLTDTAEAQ